MKQVSSIIAILLVASTSSFVVKPTSTSSLTYQRQIVKPLNIFGGDGEGPPKLTRDSEPEDYFQTDLDKKTDEEKLPIALIGLLGVSLPFILGLIALYGSQ